MVVLDAGPVIYLAKLDAFDALAVANRVGALPPSVYGEVARADLSFRHPEIPLIERARADGLLEVVDLSPDEARLAAAFGTRTSGLHSGELDVLGLGAGRGWSVCLHERQAARLARGLGIATVHVVELLVAGTPDPVLLEARVRRFARLTNLAISDFDLLLSKLPRGAE